MGIKYEMLDFDHLPKEMQNNYREEASLVVYLGNFPTVGKNILAMIFIFGIVYIPAVERIDFFSQTLLAKYISE